MSDNVTEEFKPNPCYWCGEAAVIKRGREFLGRRYELEGERTALIMLIDAFQNQEGKGG